MTAKLTTMNSAKSRANYFERDGYYAKNDPEHRKASLWYGLGSEELGLRNTVAPAKFESVLEGHVPGQDLRLGRIVDGEHVHRPGYDLTLSVPKSVSMEGLLFKQKPVIDAYNRAVASTLDWAEANFVDTRVWNRETKRMERQQTGRMVAALFRHDTSRNLDPHLHTHSRT